MSQETIITAGSLVVGALNVLLALRIRVSVLESEARITKLLRDEYYDQRTVDAKLETITVLLESRRPA